MAMFSYLEIILIATLSFLCFCHWRWINKNSPITNWPLLGMLPALLTNAPNLYEYLTQVLKKSAHTFKFKGPLFAKMDILITSDVHNLRHILIKNFPNYPKGSAFKEIFDVLGDGILRADSDSWKNQRQLLHSLMKQSKFQRHLEKCIKQKVENGVFSVFEHVSKLGIEVDLQDLFQRFTFDNSCMLTFGFDPVSLSKEFPEVLAAKAIDEIEEALIYRHILPESIWKLQKWAQIGEEKKLNEARETFDHFVDQQVSLKRELRISRTQKNEKEESFDLVTGLMEEEQQQQKMGTTPFKVSNKFLRDIVLNLFVAARDTASVGLSWFFWCISTNPSVEIKILEEIKAKLQAKEDEKKSRIFTAQEVSKLVYLHGAICESLRLYPPVPFNHKATIEPDILPSGHRVGRNSMILFSLYTVGRMEEVWGEDCLEFKPERWISEKGEIKHVPAYKFAAFSAGPRSCLAKDIALITMKTVATAIIWNYNVQVVEGHPVSPCVSVIFRMKHGLKVRITRRCE